MAFAPRSSGCFPHHMIWFDGEPLIMIGCAHCPYVSQQLDLIATYTDHERRQAIDSSRGSHARLCDRAATRRRPAHRTRRR